MKKTLLVAAIIAMVAPAVYAVPIFSGVPSTYTGAAVAEDAGYLGAPGGSEGAIFGFPGSDVSIDLTTVPGTALVNLPQASQAAKLVYGIGGANGLPAPAGFILEATTVKDGSSIAFGQELTAVVGGLWPTALVPVLTGGAFDNGVAPGPGPGNLSIAADGAFDQVVKTPSIPLGGGAFLNLPTMFSISYGPGSVGTAIFTAAYNTPPVFEIYEDWPVVATDLNIGVGSPLVEGDYTFAGAAPGLPNLPESYVQPPSQFVVGGEAGNADDKVLWAGGYIDSAIVTYRFFDPSVVGSGASPIVVPPTGPNGGYIYAIDFTGKGVVTSGYMAPVLKPLNQPNPELSEWFNGTGYVDTQHYVDDNKYIEITFAGTMFAEAFIAPMLGGANEGVDPFANWNFRTSLAGNSGDASFTVIPEPASLTLLGLGLVVPFVLRRRSK